MPRTEIYDLEENRPAVTTLDPSATARQVKSRSTFRETATKLARAVGTYVELDPAASLRAHFKCLWFHRMPDGANIPIAVVPDGCVDILWADGKLKVAGPDRTAVVETIAPGSTIVGLRFQPAAAVNWLRSPMWELVNRRVALEDFWGGEARRLADWIGEAGTPGQIARRLQLGMSRIEARIDPPDPQMKAVFAFCDPVNPANHSVTNVSDRLGVSVRTLRRRCHHVFGYGPKTLERILRFQRFLTLASRGKEIGMASFAMEAGYSDQAHLSREVRYFSGLSPRTVVGQTER
jgi:AraC-like DNA-binding protein